MPFLFTEALANELITFSNTMESFTVKSIETSYLPIYPNTIYVKSGASFRPNIRLHEI